MFLLDTNIISELRKTGTSKIDKGVEHWELEQIPSSLFISAITVLELETGIFQIERKDHHQGAILRKWLENNVLPTFADRIIPIDAMIARQCAQLHVPDPRSDRDAMIAASALVHGMTVVTRNVVDFENTGIEVINPWS